MIDELCQHITAKRRRVEVATVALRGLAAEAEAARALAEAEQRDPWSDTGDATPVPPPVAPPAPVTAPPAPAAMASAADSVEFQAPGIDPDDVITAIESAQDWAPAETLDDYPSPLHWVKQASPAALGWSVMALVGSTVLAVSAGAMWGLRVPPPQRAAVAPTEMSEPSAPAEPSMAPPEYRAPVEVAALAAVPRPEPVLVPDTVDPPPVPAAVARSVVRDSAMGDRQAPLTDASASYVPAAAPPVARLEPGAETAALERPTSLPTPSTTALAPALASATPSPIAPSPATTPTSDVLRPAGVAPSPAATVVPASTAAARPAGREAETRAIEQVLGQYRTAFNRLDAGAASAVWPTVTEKTLAKAFDSLASHDVSFDTCEIEIFSGLAEVACRGSARYVPKVGSRTPKDESREWKFSLRKNSGEWLIDRVDAR